MFLNKKKKINTNKNEVSKTINFLSLAPNYEIDNLNEYDELIDKCLKEPRLKAKRKKSKELQELKNRNIAITGDYGCGKSSIISSFFAKHSEYNYINVSMSVYSSIDCGTNDIEQGIYSYILKQILYNVRPHKIPYSKYGRMDKSSKSYYIFNAFISLSIALFILVLTKIINIENSIIKGIILSLVVFIDSMCLLQKINIKKIKLNQVDIEFKNNDSQCLNENIEELIHFFLSTSYTIIVFEDLDRHNDYLKLVRTLSLINYTINNAIHDKNKTIQFIYSISDKNFNSKEERTKFFDAIIPIKSYTNNFNSKKMIIDLLSKNGIQQVSNGNECVKFASKHLDNPRLIFDFVNQYSIYYNEKLNLKSREELFYLILYKVTYPNKFHEFIKKNNYLALYYSNKFEKYVENETKQKWSTISNENKIELLKKYNVEDIKDFDDKELNDFEKEIIKSNIFYRNSERLFINRNNLFDNLSIEDENIIHKIKNNESIIDCNFKDINSALDYIDISDFQKDSILNVQLLKHIVTKCNFVLGQQILNNLNPKKVEFIVDNEEKINFLRINKNSINKFWTVCSLDVNNKLHNNIKDKLAFYTLKYCDIQYILDETKELINYLAREKSYLKLFDEEYNEIRDKFNKLEYKLSDETKLSNYKSDITYDLFVTNKLNINSENLDYINRNLKLKINKIKLLGSIIRLEDEKIKNIFIKNINTILRCYLGQIEIQKFEENELLWIINNSDINEENIIALIDKWDGKIDDLNTFSKNNLCFESIVNKNKYVFNYSNLKIIFEYNNQLLINNKNETVKSVEFLTDVKENKELLDFIFSNILVDINQEILLNWLNALKKENMDSYIKLLLINNRNIINKENYKELLRYDKDLNFIIDGGHNIDKSYLPIIERMDQIGIISKKNIKEKYYQIFLKQKL